MFTSVWLWIVNHWTGRCISVEFELQLTAAPQTHRWTSSTQSLSLSLEPLKKVGVPYSCPPHRQYHSVCISFLAKFDSVLIVSAEVFYQLKNLIPSHRVGTTSQSLRGYSAHLTTNINNHSCYTIYKQCSHSSGVVTQLVTSTDNFIIKMEENAWHVISCFNSLFEGASESVGMCFSYHWILQIFASTDLHVVE